MEPKLKIVITDDHALFRKGLKALLSDFRFIGEILEAANGIELLDLMEKEEKKPDIILLDIKMPEMDGIEVTDKVKALYPDVKILILSMHDDEHLISHLIEKGVNGYLFKNSDPEDVEEAIIKVLDKEFYFNDNISQLVYRAFVGKNKKPALADSTFSNREIEILEMICLEHTNAEIAEKLFISQRTVEGHRKNMLSKTGVKNTAGLIIYAIKNNIVQI